MNKISTMILILFAVLLLLCGARYSNAEMTEEGVEIIEFHLAPTPAPPTPPPAQPTPTPIIIEYQHDSAEIAALARWFYGSCYKTGDLDGKRQGAWHLRNRVLDDSGMFRDSILEVIEQKGEYPFYDDENLITEENRKLAIEMLNRFQMEQYGKPAGRTLPVGYVYQIVNEKHDGYYYKKTTDGESY